jgi:GxxExxY protein
MAIAIDELTEMIIGAAINVHRELGPGLLESIYRDCLQIELGLAGLNVEVERRVSIFYRGHPIRDDLKVDLLVDGRIIVEIKAVDRIAPRASGAGHYLPETKRMPGRTPVQLQHDQPEKRTEAPRSSRHLR